MTAISNLIEWLGPSGLLATVVLLGIAYVLVLYSIIKEVYSWTRTGKQ